MSKNNNAHNKEANITPSLKGVKTGKLTEEQREFLKLYGQLIRRFDIPTTAKMLGVTKQAVYKHMYKPEKEDHEPTK